MESAKDTIECTVQSENAFRYIDVHCCMLIIMIMYINRLRSDSVMVNIQMMQFCVTRDSCQVNDESF